MRLNIEHSEYSCTIAKMFEPDNGEQVGSLWKATEDASGVAGVACEVKE